MHRMGGFEMRRRSRRGSTGWVEHELRRHRPEPRDDFVRQLSGRISADSRRRPALGLRVAFAGSFASLIVVAFAAFGGIGYAASAANSIAQTAQKVVTPKPKATSAAADQYVGKITICHHTHSKKHPMHTITVSSAAVAKHMLKHGDTLGACPSTAPTTSSSTHGKGHGKGNGQSGTTQPGQSGAQHGQSGESHGNGKNK